MPSVNPTDSDVSRLVEHPVPARPPTHEPLVDRPLEALGAEAHQAREVSVTYRARPEEATLILQEHPDLGDGLPPGPRRVATRLLEASVIVAPGSPWDPPALEPGSYGLLILEGLVGRRLQLGRAVSTELLGSGDILRPSDEPYVQNSNPPQLVWRVFQPARLAVLDQRITRLIGLRPELVLNFSTRLLRRARYAEYLTVISHLPHVADRLLATLWHVASTWGRVTPAGVRIPFRLTHALLAEMVGAQRPSVSIAMRQLEDRHELARDNHGQYLLMGAPTAWESARCEWRETRAGRPT